ncbi:metal ABC transporter substrate-binding protein [Proteiniclasticum sp. C24MP]|uniref:metal ABC transporter substrate-binding protein n=1 Tax=Proteiniclasticum sp. C24MP TaxID=3374101 RepID=UPI003754950B
MKKRLKLVIGLLALTAVIGGCSAKPSEESPVNNEPETQNEEPLEENSPEEETLEAIQVATTINPVDEIVKIVGGNLVETYRIVPEGADAHHFEPTIKDMGKLTEVDFLFINGLEMEPWVERAVENSGNSSLKLINLSKGVDLIHLDEVDEDHDHEAEEGHEHGEFDPHIWLSLDALTIMAENVKTELTAVLPEGSESFEKNYSAFVEEVNMLREAYVEKFREHEGKAFVTGHAAFGYMTRELGLVQKSVEGPFQEGEPTPKTLEDLISFVKEEGIKTIFLEDNASPKVSETLARETESETVAINPLAATGDLLETMEETYEKVLKSFNK